MRAVDEAYRREWASVLAATVRLVGDLDLAEECVQDAFVRAVEVWAADGVPPNPGGWLTTTARRRAIDVLRRERTLRAKLPLLVEPEPQPEPGPDLLRLVFTCAHPALAPDARLTLTLRMVCGLTTAQIAQALLVPEATAAARLTRAKKKVAAARIPYRVPAERDLPARLDTVLTVVHLVYTAGHTASDGDSLVRADLVTRAIDLARTLHRLMPDEREVRALLGLLLLTDARRPARTDAAGDLVLLEHQDRSLWRAGAVAEGRALVVSALQAVGRPGRYALQAAIAAVHAEAPSWDDTDWPQILALYDLLLTVEPSPVVALNRAVALAFVKGPAAGLAAVDDLAEDPRLRAYPYLPAARADLLRRLCREAEAATAYREALALTSNAAERAYLQRRLDELG